MAMGDAPHKSGRRPRHKTPGASRRSSVQTSAKSKADSRSVKEQLERLDNEQTWVGGRNNTPGRDIVRGTAGQLLSLAIAVRPCPACGTDIPAKCHPRARGTAGQLRLQ